MVIMLILKVYSCPALLNHTKNFLILSKIIGYIMQYIALKPYGAEYFVLSYYFENHNSVIWEGFLICFSHI